MLQNAYFLAKIGADTAENEQYFAKNLRKTDNYPTGPGAAAGHDAGVDGPPPRSSASTLVTAASSLSGTGLGASAKLAELAKFG